MPKEPQPRFLRLDEIEAEGDAAGDETARTMLNDILREGGRIDWSAVSKSGPMVARALLRLSIQAARRNVRPPTVSPARSPTSRPSKLKVSKPRVEKNWRELQTDPQDSSWDSFLWGAGTATIVSLVAMALIRLLHL